MGGNEPHADLIPSPLEQVATHLVDKRIPGPELSHRDVARVGVHNAIARIIFFERVDITLFGETQGCSLSRSREVLAVRLKSIVVQQGPCGHIMRNTDGLAVVAVLDGVLFGLATGDRSRGWGICAIQCNGGGRSHRVASSRAAGHQGRELFRQLLRIPEWRVQIDLVSPKQAIRAFLLGGKCIIDLGKLNPAVGIRLSLGQALASSYS